MIRIVYDDGWSEEIPLGWKIVFDGNGRVMIHAERYSFPLANRNIMKHAKITEIYAV